MKNWPVLGFEFFMSRFSFRVKESNPSNVDCLVVFHPNTHTMVYEAVFALAKKYPKVHPFCRLKLKHIKYNVVWHKFFPLFLNLWEEKKKIIFKNAKD